MRKTVNVRHGLGVTAAIVVLTTPRGYSAPQADLNLWPLVTLEAGEETFDLRMLGPLGQVTDRNGNRVRALRPLFISQSGTGKGRSLDLAWPLVRFARSDGDDLSGHVGPVAWRVDESGRRHVSVIPVAWRWWHRDERKGEEHGVVVVPTWRAGEYDDDTDWTWGVAPLVCRWRKGDQRGLWLLPVYHQKDGEQLEALAIAPFYWQFDDSQVLFPLYWSFDGGDFRMLFPLYGYRKGGHGKEWRMVLWPAYMGERDGDYREQHLLWPVLKWGNGGGKRAFRLWPLVGVSRKSWRSARSEGRRRSLWLGWPVFWRGQSAGERTRRGGGNEQERRRTYTGTHLNLFPFYWSGTRDEWKKSADGGVGEMTRQDYHSWLLPLYTYNRGLRKSVFTMLWPVWCCGRGEKEDQYSVLWRLVDVRRYANGDRRTTVLWRGFRDEKRGSTRKVDVFPAITYRRTGPDDVRLQFLGGLLGFGRQAGRPHLRLLYLPRIPLG